MEHMIRNIVKHALAVYLVVLPTAAWGVQMYNQGAADPMLWMVVIVGALVGLYVVYGPKALTFAVEVWERLQDDGGSD